MRRNSAVATVLLLAAAPAPAHAARWTAPARFVAGGGDGEPAPRVAVSAAGRATAAWSVHGKRLVVRSGLSVRRF